MMLAPARAEAGPCRDVGFEGASYTVCEIAAEEDLRLFHAGPAGAYGSFAAVEAALALRGLRLGVAMNAGMFHDDLAPVGLYVEEGVRRTPLVTRAGPGNFGMLPNGVFCIRPPGAAPRFAVVESRAFAAAPPDCLHATQSGPMLVIGGALHPRFLPRSDSRHIRNGVGVVPGGGRAILAISNDRVNFHTFARFFRDVLGTPDALYLDGSVSRLHAPGIGRSDLGFSLGPILGTVVPKD
jgi:uncharacterized protein YigE (DUF2233 family)